MKQITLFRTERKAMHKNRKGGIEGLPLQLLIIIVVASLGLAIILAETELSQVRTHSRSSGMRPKSLRRLTQSLRSWNSPMESFDRVLLLLR
ncbi:MAG: hypothetical protein II855_05650 [Candidatus Methanomethylophilaceae archaeon]|nr:hypothetical protein [Candidatus Methanomethylophilaceae archaeon]